MKSAVQCAPERASRLQQWVVQLQARVGYQKALVAIANKNARIAWALLTSDAEYRKAA